MAVRRELHEVGNRLAILKGVLPKILDRHVSLHISSSCKIRLHTKNQLHSLPGSALKVTVWGGWWVPTHYQVKLQLLLRLSWAV